MAFHDKVGAKDTVHARLVTEVVAPHYPCPMCGKETNDHPIEDINMATRSRVVTRARRICTSCGEYHFPDG